MGWSCGKGRRGGVPWAYDAEDAGDDEDPVVVAEGEDDAAGGHEEGTCC